MKEKTSRKPLRLKNHDYNRVGVYFVTICVKDKHEILGDVVGNDTSGIPHVQLSQYGNYVREEIDRNCLHYTHIAVEKFVIMPNHVHLLIRIQENKERDMAPKTECPTKACLPDFIRFLKRKTNRIIGFNIWQPSFHDRIIRNNAEYQQISKYIDDNPSKWEQDRYHIKKHNSGADTL